MQARFHVSELLDEKHSGTFRDPSVRIVVSKPFHIVQVTQIVGTIAAYSAIDFTNYSLLPNGLVSMLTYFSMSGADKDYIPMFPWTNLFLAVLRLNDKVISNPTKHKT
jgi:hypothetical protein